MSAQVSDWIFYITGITVWSIVLCIAFAILSAVVIILAGDAMQKGELRLKGLLRKPFLIQNPRTGKKFEFLGKEVIASKHISIIFAWSNSTREITPTPKDAPHE